ncbi:hypothetical protein TraAM80_01693 [Trypanosoma rangeli]|uniref:Uncharacterized protein n=1 Tax=Trypanosoma rangeli TaxID=5698 RepID=A0A3R7MZ77_TRYRA|nr:uncharacterized protein TraAM80_01693 [Trypanosoma rangeli]RNF10333.1 hypothetical protein TraAM80_01693 [Trypanosoma rangeli]|eukprot:RNF10333.1 hypothetical protein TraAM80_01693 [Trypanosoma rangeli]
MEKGTVQLPPLDTPRQTFTQGNKKKRMLEVEKSSAVKGRSISTASTTKRSINRPGKEAAVPVDTVMEMNKKSIALMKDGKMKASYDMLQTALAAAEAGVRRFPTVSKESNSEAQEQREAWLLAFAATLSNLGCLQRRDNQLYEAIRYLQDARNVESQVFGRPSCSTMVNLSAVLLELGSTEEALVISRDCVLASEQSDPMLHTIALHNYGVTLSQHASEEMRQSAVPVLMKALRQAQLHLGEEHPTTMLIRQHCGMTLQKPQEQGEKCQLGSTAFVTQGHREETKQPLAADERLPPLVPASKYLQQAKEAVESLNYGDIPLFGESHASSYTESKQESKSTQRSSKPETDLKYQSVTSYGRGKEELSEDLSKRRSSPNEPVVVFFESAAEETLARQYSSMVTVLTASCSCSAEESVEEEKEEREKRTKCDSDIDDDDDGKKRMSLKVVTPTLREGKKESDVVYDPLEHSEESRKGSGANSDAHGGAGEGAEPSKGEEEGKCHQTAMEPPKLDMTQRPATFTNTGFFFVIGAQAKQPELPFYRFAPLEASLLAKESSGEQNAAATEASTPKLEKQKLLKPVEEEEEEEEEEYEEQEMCGFEHKEIQGREKHCLPTPVKAIAKKREAFVKLIGVNPAIRREENIRQERLEEELLRSRLRKEAEEKAQKEHFERTLAAIVSRTRDRAVRKIQYMWCMWWNSVGKRRRELLIKRTEEKARRERLRQALLEHEQQVEEQRRQKRMSKKKSGIEAIPSVFCCGKKWLLRTLCVRYLARRGIPRDDKKEAFFVLQLSKIQAVWRGHYVRLQMRDKSVARAQKRMCNEQLEREVYAAMVIQMCVRQCLARKAREKNIIEHYGPPAIKIQRWFRAVMPRRRGLGVDKVSKWRKQYSARLIQRAWRGYLCRLAYFMEKLRYKLDEDKRHKRVASSVLQRVGRGFICRSLISRQWLKRTCLRTTVHLLEWGDGELDRKRNVIPTSPPPTVTYVPTPVEEVNAIAQMEREKYHIGLFVDVVAKRHCTEWKEALRLRPFEVLRRRAHENHLCELELNAFRREHAAVKIQREFRQWLHIRDSPFRDKTLLLIARGDYQVLEYGRKIDRIRHTREQEAGQEIFGDQVAPMRKARAAAQAELREVHPLVRTHVPQDKVRSLVERREVENELQRDEHLIKQQLHAEALLQRRESHLRRAIEAGIISSQDGFIQKKLVQ